MQRRRKILVWIFSVLSLFLSFALAFQVLAPRIIDLEPVRNKIEATLSKVLGGDVTVQRLDLTLFPRPCVNARLLRMSIPGMLEGSVDSLSIYPRILPLFTGKLRVAAIKANVPDFAVRLPEKPLHEKKAKEPDTLAAVKEAITAAGARLASIEPSLTIVMHRGKVAVSQGRKPPLNVEHIDAQVVFPPRGFIINLDCTTAYWNNLTLQARLDPVTFAAAGSIEVEALKPHLLGPFLFPDGPSLVADSLMNIELSFKTDGVKNLQVNVASSAPHLRLLRNRTTLLIENARFHGSVELDDQKTVITLDGLEAASPRLNLQGEMHSDETTPRAGLTVAGSDIDIQALRQAVLFLAPDDPTVQSIFDILRAGTVPAITVESTGKTPSDLGDLGHMRITAALQGGSIDIPGTMLHLTNAGGNVVISEGILHGDRLSARLGNTTAQDGTVRLGIKDGEAPFHLDIMVKADLAELPPILQTFISDRAFLHELSLLRNVKGTAQGRLVLGKSIRSIDVTTDISAFELSAAYERVPVPIRINGGRFFFDGKKISLEQISADFGKSSLAELTARLDLAAPSSLKITSVQSSLVLDEVYPWLSSIEGLKEALKGIETMQGTVLLSIQNASLPLAKAGTLRFTAAGSLNNLSVGSTSLPGLLSVSGGRFNADAETLSFSDMQGRIVDSSFSISGALPGYLHTLQQADLTVKGTIGAEVARWIRTTASLPPHPVVRTPLDIAQARITLQKDGTVRIAGNAAVRKGPAISFDLQSESRGLTIDSLIIGDKESHAVLTLNLFQKAADASFSGNLTHATLTGIFEQDVIPFGWIKGDFRAHVALDRLSASTAQGTIEGENLVIPANLNAPVTVDRISLRADATRVTVSPLRLTLGKNKLTMNGDVISSPEGTRVDMDAYSDGIVWENVKDLLGPKKERTSQTLPKAKKTWGLPLQGTVRFKTDSITYGRLMARPVHADISLAPDRIDVALTQADVCGIIILGNVTLTPAGVQLDLRPGAAGQALQSAAACLTGGDARITGVYDLSGRITAGSAKEPIVKSLQGTIKFRAKNGKIYHAGLVTRILAFLNVTDMLRGKFNDPLNEGFPFESITIRGKLLNGVATVTEAVVEGAFTDIIATGTIDLDDQKLEATVLVAPFKTADEVVRHIPLVNYILGNTIVTVPLKIRGTIQKPEVSYNPASSVAEGTFGIMKRTLQAPFKVIDPFLPGERKEP